ncbi:hypothetical protein GIB67_025504 [Kingdonia uniflora]|uniref:Ionotropic glutamate receptor C-terminal domain-containing protein n=1 Tax=Kingdonia uniflora TaxID=39325 RepID=A0A7J7PCK0_9MAGN|nr:hypothetical protein GIB67_025504 [Kingdonia uniflora]
MDFMKKDAIWIAADSVTSIFDTVGSSVLSTMEGVIGIKTYFSETNPSFKDFLIKFRKSFQSEYREEQTFEPGSPIYQIVKVIRKGYIELKFWSPEFGFSDSDLSTSNGESWTLKVHGSVENWPWGLLERGWVMPTELKPMNIGVPGRTSFEKFVKMKGEDPTEERLQSNFSRSVILVWLFIVFILRFSYIANLPTMLTVERLHSHSTDIDYLRKNNSKVGCDGDSFILTYLKEVLHFLPENIMEIPSEYSYPDALNNGSSFSGAPLRESLPLQILRRIQGYGTDLQIWRPWVFRKGSPFAADFSEAFLKLLESGNLTKLEDKWFIKSSKCSKQENNYKSLSLRSFWSLFVLTGGGEHVSGHNTLGRPQASPTIEIEMPETSVVRSGTQSRALSLASFPGWHRRGIHGYTVLDQTVLGL